jgi:cell division FtsZ-interacting protein ZapD
MKLIIWKLKMLVAKLKHPGAGYYERMCLLGDTQKMISIQWLMKRSSEVNTVVQSLISGLEKKFAMKTLAAGTKEEASDERISLY